MANSPLATNTTIHNYVRYDARSEILRCVGDLSDMELFGTQLIVAPYVHSGLMWSDKLGFPREERLSLERLYELYESNRGFVVQEHSVESIYTGKVLLVVKIGEDVITQGHLDAMHDQLQSVRASENTEAINRLRDRYDDAVDRSHGARPLQVGDWVVTLQENTRQVSITSPTAQKSRVLEFVGVKYAAGWPAKFVYESDIYGRIHDPDMVV